MLGVAPKTVKTFSWPVVSSGHLFLMLFAAFSGTVNAAVYDLSSDWSNSSNPNGPWSYNQGSTPLPLVPNFNFGNTGWASSCNQPAWVPSNATGDYLPAFLKVDACVTTTENTQYPLANVVAGDVWVHTVDGFNGNPSLGAANVLFTLPASGGAGSYTISGSLWDSLSSSPTSSSRPQDWSLFVNGVQVATGVLSGNVFRSQAQTFSMVKNLNVGDRVELQIVKDPAASAGFIVSINLTITGPQPTAPAFFTGEASVGSGVYYLRFTDGNSFGYYNFPSSSILYHYDMGFEAFVPGSANDIYFYDFTSTHWFYTSTTLFPYLYDFTLNAWIYYFPNPASPGNYTTNPRYFSNLTTGQVFTM
jgi:hypothetical protein